MRARFGLAAAALFFAACATAPPPAQPRPEPTRAQPAVTREPTTVVAAVEAPLLEAPDAWQLLDLDADGVPGVSATRTYRELLAGREPSRTIVVAVIDGGIDTAHVDLSASLWRNPGEIAGNGIDDDGNGYVDDVHGWNFLGGADGRSVGHETLEVTRLYAACEQGAAAPRGLSCEEITTDFEARRTEYTQTLEQIDQISAAFDFALPLLREATGGEEPTVESVTAVKSPRGDVQQARNIFLQLAAADLTPDVIVEARESYEGLLQYGLDPEFRPRNIVGDDLEDGLERLYGNPDVMGPDASHGTHVSGIIGAVRGNGLGLDGVASGTEVMMIRAVPDGDERDKDIANAIRYAVDNGAHIINMSFGKSYSPQKPLVDAAIRYADERGVLMIHAAGNDGEDLETEFNFPSRDYDDGGSAANWIEVGAANWSVESIAATFSNYGQTRVDVFAPGVDILSTVPGSEFKRQDGTSMAAPVVSGVAAMLMAYFPNLTASDVRRILLESSVKHGERVVEQPGSGDLVPFGSLSVTGGLVNAYAAVLMARERM